MDYLLPALPGAFLAALAVALELAYARAARFSTRKAKGTELHLYGSVYDGLRFAAAHPGGSLAVENALVPRDAPDTARAETRAVAEHLFEAYHDRRGRKRRLAVLERFGSSRSAPEEVTDDNDVFRRDLVEATAPVLQMFASKSLVKVTLFSTAWICIASLAVVAALTAPITAVALSWLAGGAFVALGFVAMHDGSHDVYEGCRYVALAWNAVAWWDHGLWSNHHVCRHHAHVNNSKSDPDRRHLPFSCVPGWPPCLMWAFLLFVPGVFFGQALSYQWALLEGNSSSWPHVSDFTFPFVYQELRRTRWTRLAFRCVLPLWLIGFGLASRSAAFSLLCLAAFCQAAGLAYGANILPDHHALPERTPRQDHASPGHNRPWKRQVEQSANWSGPWYCWFWGGINYQVEHHLFPRVPHDAYPLLAPFVRAVCERHGVSYVHHPSLASALAVVHRSFAANASPWRALWKHS